MIDCASQFFLGTARITKFSLLITASCIFSLGFSKIAFHIVFDNLVPSATLGIQLDWSKFLT